MDDLIRQIEDSQETDLRDRLTALSARIEIGPENLTLSVSRTALMQQIDPDVHPCEPDERLVSQLPLHLRKRGIETKLVLGESISTEPDRGLVKLIADDRLWARQLLAGEFASVRALAGAQGLDHRHVARALPFAFLAPDIVEAILEGRQPDGLTVTSLKQLKAPPLRWEDQRRALGLNGVD